MKVTHRKPPVGSPVSTVSGCWLGSVLDTGLLLVHMGPLRSLHQRKRSTVQRAYKPSCALGSRQSEKRRSSLSSRPLLPAGNSHRSARRTRRLRALWTAAGALRSLKRSQLKTWMALLPFKLTQALPPPPFSTPFPIYCPGDNYRSFSLWFFLQWNSWGGGQRGFRGEL